MFKSKFERKVGLGFAFIILLLVISAASTLWFLNRIEGSSLRVTDTAVPVVKGSNEVQIQLLKLAKISSLAFNRNDEESLLAQRDSFREEDEYYETLTGKLDDVTQRNEAMTRLMSDVEEHHDVYVEAVEDMISARLAFMRNRERVAEEAETLNGLVDNVGGALEDIAYAVRIPDEYADEMEETQGYATYANQLLLSAVKTIREVSNASDPEGLNGAKEDLLFAVRDSRLRLDSAARIFEPLDEEGRLPKAYSAYDELQDRINADDNLITYKRQELTNAQLAREKLQAADEAANKAVAKLDELVALADSRFNDLQSNVFNTLNFSFNSTLIVLVVLTLLATQNFNTMRKAIRRKIEDLGELNRISQSLAAAQERDTALEEILNSMQSKIGVSRGSVYLTNNNNELALEAFFPPNEIEESSEAASFNQGEGVIGQAAETRSIIFVPNTLRDEHYMSRDTEQAQSLLCVPLLDNDSLLGVINLSGDVRSVSFADSDYEFAATVAQSLVTTLKNIQMRETIEEYNRNLEEKVRERTAALQQKNRDIANMMANMHQGLFTITPSGMVHPEYSAFLEQIFETGSIAERNFSELMFSKARLSGDEIDQCVTAVGTIVGEDEIMFDFNAHCLPEEMIIMMDDGRQKILEMDWSPIVSDDGAVEKLMVTVRDVTELKALEAEASRQREELEMIGEILGIEANQFLEFASVSGDLLSRCRALIEKTPEKDPEVIATLFRNMHTIKGNARTYNLRQITDKVHEVEQTYDQLRRHENMEWDRETLLRELDETRELLDHYREIFGDKLGRDQETRGITMDRERIRALLRDMQDMVGQSVPSPIQRLMRDTYSTLVQVEAQPISTVIRDVIDSVNSLAQDLDKPEPTIEIDDGELFIKREIHSTLNNIFTHVFRNAIDHGIEPPAERREHGKPEKGWISVTVAMKGETAVMEVRDDGRGLALNRIYAKALENNLYSSDSPRPPASEIANLIFSSGFSTAEQVSEISGRGVGMDAVRAFLQREGGDIEVVLDPGPEDADFRGFVTRITLPARYTIILPDFDRQG